MVPQIADRPQSAVGIDAIVVSNTVKGYRANLRGASLRQVFF